jgi:transcriptional regulator with XRE-family HTH domain
VTSLAALPAAQEDPSPGPSVTELRRRHGISQEELARRVGTTKSAISRLESGRHWPNVETLWRIAEAVGARLVISFD